MIFRNRPERSRAYPAFYTIGTISLTRVRRPGNGVNHLPLSSVDVKERVELYPYYPSVSAQQFTVQTFLFTPSFTVNISVNFHVLLTVHLSIILVINQLNAQILVL